jgi:hypothetical protein
MNDCINWENPEHFERANRFIEAINELNHQMGWLTRSEMDQILKEDPDTNEMLFGVDATNETAEQQSARWTSMINDNLRDSDPYWQQVGEGMFSRVLETERTSGESTIVEVFIGAGDKDTVTLALKKVAELVQAFGGIAPDNFTDVDNYIYPQLSNCEENIGARFKVIFQG